MNSRSYKRKVTLDEEPFFNPITNQSDEMFRKGRYFDDPSVEPGKGSLYLTVPEAAISSYYNKLRALGHSNILMPLSFCKVGSDFRIFFEDKLTCKLMDFVDANEDRLFSILNEYGRDVYTMAPALQQVIFEILSTYDDLHAFGMVHTCMTVDNTWIYKDDRGVYHPKLFDLGVDANSGLGNFDANKVEDRRSIGRLIRTIFDNRALPCSVCVVDLIRKLDRHGLDIYSIGKYRRHPIFFKMGNKQCTIRQLVAANLSLLNHRAICPNIPQQFRDVEKFIAQMRNEFEYRESSMERMIKDLEEVWPLVWVDLQILCDKAYNIQT